MKRTGCNGYVLFAHQICQSGLHLRRRKSGKRNNQNLFWFYMALFYQIANPVYDSQRLT